MLDCFWQQQSSKLDSTGLAVEMLYDYISSNPLLPP